jgi:hypothetical protein
MWYRVIRLVRERQTPTTPTTPTVTPQPVDPPVTVFPSVTDSDDELAYAAANLDQGTGVHSLLTVSQWNWYRQRDNPGNNIVTRSTVYGNNAISRAQYADLFNGNGLNGINPRRPRFYFADWSSTGMTVKLVNLDTVDPKGRVDVMVSKLARMAVGKFARNTRISSRNSNR